MFIILFCVIRAEFKTTKQDYTKASRLSKSDTKHYAKHVRYPFYFVGQWQLYDCSCPIILF